ncbi:MAG: diaminopimelate epimerase [Gammaproteobacteria bacterium]
MHLTFTKMHGLGNDFIVLEDIADSLQLDGDLIRRLADRRRGIGFDQLLLLQSGTSAKADIRYRVFNADGNEVEQCGNGIRCVAHYLRERGIISGDQLLAETANGTVRADILPDDQVRVDMGVPAFSAAAIPVSLDELHNPVSIDLPDGPISAMVLSLGNPHAVLTVSDVSKAPLATLGPAIQQHQLFPASVNVGFMQIIDRTHIKLRVYERGAGETPACGSGACAAVVAGIASADLEHEVNVALQGGELQVSWAGDNQAVSMTGPATSVYTGEIEI